LRPTPPIEEGCSSDDDDEEPPAPAAAVAEEFEEEPELEEEEELFSLAPKINTSIPSARAKLRMACDLEGEGSSSTTEWG
jgi:hypothetical protein